MGSISTATVSRIGRVKRGRGAGRISISVMTYTQPPSCHWAREVPALHFYSTHRHTHQHHAQPAPCPASTTPLYYWHHWSKQPFNYPASMPWAQQRACLPFTLPSTAVRGVTSTVPSQWGQQCPVTAIWQSICVCVIPVDVLGPDSLNTFYAKT